MRPGVTAPGSTWTSWGRCGKRPSTCLRTGRPHVWLHADLKPTNVLVKDGRFHAVIDFGALSVGLPDAEHAVVWDLPEAAREAYRARLDIDDLTWARARAWALALAVNGIAEYWVIFPVLATEGLNRHQAIVRDASRA